MKTQKKLAKKIVKTRNTTFTIQHGSNLGTAASFWLWETEQTSTGKWAEHFVEGIFWYAAFEM